MLWLNPITYTQRVRRRESPKLMEMHKTRFKNDTA